MKSVIRWILGVLAVLLVLSAVGIAIAAFPNALAVDTLEIIASLVGAAICCFLCLQRMSPTAYSFSWEKLYKRQFWIALTCVAAWTLSLMGHAHWQAIGSRSVDVYDAAENLVQELVAQRNEQHINTIYVSVQNHPVRPDLVADLEKRYRGVKILPIDQLTQQQRNQGYAGERADIIEIDGFSYPAWRVVEMRFTYARCSEAQDYFYFNDRWLRMGVSVGGGCI